jgi:hypothetical protein
MNELTDCNGHAVAELRTKESSYLFWYDLGCRRGSMLGEISACCGIPRNYKVDSHLLHKKVSKNLLAVYGSPCSDGAVEEVGRRPWPEGSSVLQWIILQTQAQRGMPFAAVIGPTDPRWAYGRSSILVGNHSQSVRTFGYEMDRCVGLRWNSLAHTDNFGKG